MWKIFGLKKKLDMDFYGERHNFLALIGLHVYEINGEFSKPENIKVALIPASEVLRHFNAITSSTHNIAISRSTLESNKELKWRRFFGLANIKETLARELELQEREYRRTIQNK